MQNLGYFQLQAAPGVWNLALAPGRASELYAITAPEGEDEPTGLVWKQRRAAHTAVDDGVEECVRGGARSKCHTPA